VRRDATIKIKKPNQKAEWGKHMRLASPLLLAGAALAAAGATAMAHHSFAMFDSEHPIQIAGTVQEFKYTSPHSFILLEVKGKDGGAATWNLEGAAPSIIARDGWSSKSLRPGDELEMTIDPLRSGAPGGAWNLNKIQFKGGKPIVGGQ
jgi:Family of unknown function (DUF6152)